VDPYKGETFKTSEWTKIVRDSVSAPSQALAALLDCIDHFTDDELCWVGVEAVEAIVDCGWPGIRAEFEAALRTSSNFRKAASCAGPQPDGTYELIQRSLRPGEDIGRKPRNT
jgi:hypothetical protein